MPVISSAPTKSNSVFNPGDYQTATGGLSQTVADSRYIQKSTGIGRALSVSSEARVGNGNIVLGQNGNIDCFGRITTSKEIKVTSNLNGDVMLTEGKLSCSEVEVWNTLNVDSMCSLDNTGNISGSLLNISGDATLGSVTVTPSTLTVNSLRTGVNNLILRADNGITFSDGTVQNTAGQNTFTYSTLYNSSSGTAGVSTINIPANCNYVSIVGVAAGGSAAPTITYRRTIFSTPTTIYVTGGCGGGGGGFNIPYFGITQGNLTVSISPTQTSVSYMNNEIVTAYVGGNGLADFYSTVSSAITTVGAGGDGGSASFSSAYSYLTGCGAFTTTGITGSAGESTSFVVNNKVGHNPLFVSSLTDNTGVYGAGGCPPLYDGGISVRQAAIPTLGGAVIVTFHVPN